MPEFKTVAKVGEIAVGQGKAFEFEDQVVAVFLQADGTYLAIDDLCPHMGASLATGHFEDGVVTCPWHAWSFDARDGAWCDNRKLKIATFQVRVEGDVIQLAANENADQESAGNPLGGATYGGPVAPTHPCSSAETTDDSNPTHETESNSDGQERGDCS
jgi:nitrite reductase (NADH) small subunit/3-phenylpropionate/trans-cinnamate dioxygenase ferredoxin subunit